MKLIFQFLIILVFSFVGELLNALLPLPIPASIYGIVLMYAALHFKIIKVEDVRDVSTFLIKMMPIILLPPSVGVIEQWDVIKDDSISFILISIVSTVVVMSVAGLVTQAIIRHNRKEATK